MSVLILVTGVLAALGLDSQVANAAGAWNNGHLDPRVREQLCNVVDPRNLSDRGTPASSYGGDFQKDLFKGVLVFAKRPQDNLATTTSYDADGPVGSTKSLIKSSDLPCSGPDYAGSQVACGSGKTIYICAPSVPSPEHGSALQVCLEMLAPPSMISTTGVIVMSGQKTATATQYHRDEDGELVVDERTNTPATTVQKTEVPGFYTLMPDGTVYFGSCPGRKTGFDSIDFGKTSTWSSILLAKGGMSSSDDSWSTQDPSDQQKLTKKYGRPTECSATRADGPDANNKFLNFTVASIDHPDAKTTMRNSAGKLLRGEDYWKRRRANLAKCQSGLRSAKVTGEILDELATQLTAIDRGLAIPTDTPNKGPTGVGGTAGTANQ